MQKNGEENLKLLEKDIDNLIQHRKQPVDMKLVSALRSFNSDSPTYIMPEFEKREVQPYEYEYDKESELLLFSGGRVSTATALRLRAMHRNITLFHVNTNSKEDTRCSELADILKLPLLCVDAGLCIKSHFAGMALAFSAQYYAAYHGFSPKIYMGVFDTASIQNNAPKDWRYCCEFIGAYNTTVRDYIKGAKVVGIMPSYSVVEDELSRSKEIQQYFQ